MNQINNRPKAKPDFLCVCGGGGGSNWSNFGTFYDYAWIILRSRWIWPFFFFFFFWGGEGVSDDPPGYGPEQNGKVVNDAQYLKHFAIVCLEEWNLLLQSGSTLGIQ